MITSNERTTTKDHAHIEQWAKERGAYPAIFDMKTGQRNSVDVLTFRFKGHQSENLKEISWEEFFQKFDDYGLLFEHDQQRQYTFKEEGC